jgi:predicted nucleic acid-binding protein
LIVADANILLYLLSPGPFHKQAEALRKKDSDWRVPPVWSLEFSNALAKAVRDKRIGPAEAEAMMEEALRYFSKGEVPLSALEALKAANRFKLSSYDASYLALAQFLNVPLVTEDKEVLVRSGGIGQSLAQILS